MTDLSSWIFPPQKTVDQSSSRFPLLWLLMTHNSQNYSLGRRNTRQQWKHSLIPQVGGSVYKGTMWRNINSLNWVQAPFTRPPRAAFGYSQVAQMTGASLDTPYVWASTCVPLSYTHFFFLFFFCFSYVKALNQPQVYSFCCTYWQLQPDAWGRHCSAEIGVSSHKKRLLRHVHSCAGLCRSSNCSRFAQCAQEASLPIKSELTCLYQDRAVRVVYSAPWIPVRLKSHLFSTWIEQQKPTLFTIAN